MSDKAQNPLTAHDNQPTLACLMDKLDYTNIYKHINGAKCLKIALSHKINVVRYRPIMHRNM
jgi:hypothetical protein